MKTIVAAVAVAILAAAILVVQVRAQAIARGDGMVIERYGSDWCGPTAKVIIRPAGKMNIKLSDPAVQRLLGTARIGLSVDCPQATRIVVYADGANGVTLLAEANASNGWTFAEAGPGSFGPAQPPSSPPSVPVQSVPVRNDFPALLTGTWRGNYCGGSSTTWWIDASPQRAWAREQWCNAFTCGHVDYRIVQISNAQRRLEMKASVGTGFSLSGYSILFQASGDGSRLDGTYFGHPRCNDVHVARVGELGNATPLTSSTIAPLPRTRASLTVTTTEYEFHKVCYAAALAGIKAAKYESYRQQLRNQLPRLEAKARSAGMALGFSGKKLDDDISLSVGKRFFEVYSEPNGTNALTEDLKSCGIYPS